ncbi:O-antigen ligase family protein [Mycolicibacterium sp. P1-18]|uniref:O-antigen ligase family protein n=1 Tax=Mycolicibacterium sp. P1-18 TaxID=2024615 RepID=UPI0011F1EEA2|nr:O-antigen ligase family protein [Mycolicibacterium sp. P1-18]KAA0098823.1 O-antigen ligase family protein [Mycolicibacterium sp. P1-18]
MAPTRVFPSPTPTVRQNRRVLALIVVLAIGLAVVPEVITHLNVKHTPDLPPLEDDSASSKFPLAHLASLAGSALLLLLSSAVAVKRGRPNRNVTGVLVLLLAVNVPYLISPVVPAPGDLIKVVLANTVVLALWNMGASITELKWLPIIVSCIGVYSIIGGLLIPDYMMYNLISEKSIVAGWELAGPFGHGNVLGMYCAVAFALVPLVDGTRWRIVCATILFATVVLSASRTALLACLVVLLWWAATAVRRVFSVRLAGTVGALAAAIAMVVIPFLDWDPRAFTERAAIWAASIVEWSHSPVQGLGVNWFMTNAQSTGNIAAWAYVGTGHNLAIDTLVKSGLIGFAVLVPVLLGAISAARSLPDRNQQIACFGFLLGFFVAATTEAVWALLPNLQLFPISGLVFAMLNLNRYGDRAEVSTP